MGFFNTCLYRIAFLTLCFVVNQVFVRDSGDFDLDVDPVQQWARYFSTIARDLIGRAMAFAIKVSQIAAWA